MPPVSKESPTSKSGELLHLAAAKAISYVDNIRERAVGTAQAALAALAGFHEPFPAEPCDPAQVLKQLDAMGSPATTATTGGRYFGFVNGRLSWLWWPENPWHPTA